MLKKSMMCVLILLSMQMRGADNMVSEEQACEDAKKVFIELCEDADNMSRLAVEFTLGPQRCQLSYFAMTAKCMKVQQQMLERQRARDTIPHYLD